MTKDLDLLNRFWQVINDARGPVRLYKNVLNRAVPFTLDREAVRMIVQLTNVQNQTYSEDVQRLLLYKGLARLPFDCVWIEINYDDRLDARIEFQDPSLVKAEDAPQRLGWLLTRLDDTTWSAVTVGTGIDAVDLITFPYAHVLSTDGDVDPKYQHQMKTSVAQLHSTSSVQWGFLNTSSDDTNNYEVLLNSAAVQIAPDWKDYVTDTQEREIALHGTLNEQGGDLRFLVGALAMINCLPREEVPYKPRGGMRAGGSIKHYLVNRTISIKIPARVRKATSWAHRQMKLTEIRMRRHRVRGHFRIIKKLDGTQERTWVKDHLRGDGSLGWVQQDYQITA